MNRGRFAPLLEDCLHRLDKGESLRVVLNDYPTKADRLKTLLGLALVSRALPKPTPGQAAMRAGINHLLEEMNNLQRANGFRRMEPKPASRQLKERWLGNIPNLFPDMRVPSLNPIYRLVMVGVVVIMAGSVLTINTSSSSLPGDPLYDLKLGLEQARMFLTFEEEAKQDLALVFERERLSEVETLLAGDRSERVRFHGTIEVVEESTQIISGIHVQVGPETNLVENLEEGEEVEVSAITQEDGTLMALMISADGDDLEDLDDDLATGSDKDKDKDTGEGKDKEKNKEDNDKDKDKEKNNKDKDKDKNKEKNKKNKDK